MSSTAGIKRKGRPKALDLKSSIGAPLHVVHVGGASVPDDYQDSFVPSRAAPSTPPAPERTEFMARPSSLTTSSAPVRPPRSPVRPVSPAPSVEQPESIASEAEVEYFDTESTPTMATNEFLNRTPIDERIPQNPPRAESPTDTIDVAGHIAFRSAPQSPVRTLYSAPSPHHRIGHRRESLQPTIIMTESWEPPSPTRTTTIAEQVGHGGRRPSLVNPEDYMPGFAVSTDGGRAMTAGFEPPSPSRARISSYANVRRTSYGAKPVGQRRASSLRTDWSSSDALSEVESPSHIRETSNDLAEYSPTRFEHTAEERKGSVAPGEMVVVPTLLFDRTRLTEAIPRDPITGKIDWRARLAVKQSPSRDISPTSTHFIDKDGLFESSLGAQFARSTGGSSSGSPDEKSMAQGGMKEYFTSSASLHSHGGRKQFIQIVERESPEYTRLGKLFLCVSPVTFFLSIAAVVFYLFIRCVAILRATYQTERPYVSAWIFYAFEATMALWIVAYNFTNIVNMRFKSKPRYTIKGDVCLPTVDVLILATGQDTSMVMDCVVAAAHLDWPIDKLRVLVIDEALSDTTKRAVDYYSNNRALHVTYHRRRADASKPGTLPKSSSINLGLAETRANGRVSGEYVVVLEAESICEPELLRYALPHLIQNPLVGLLTTPSGFYNLPRNLGLSFSTFVRSTEPVEDSRSAFIMRRCAVDDVGGFPTRSSVEDCRLASILEGRGYRVSSIDETLQYSLIPDTFSRHLRQRVDRDLAHIKTASRLNFFLAGHRVAHMSFGSRVSAMCRAIAPFTSIVMLMNMMIFPVAIGLGGFLVPALSLGELNLMIWAALAVVLTERLHDFFFAVPAGRASVHRHLQAQIFMAPYLVIGLFRAMLPAFLRRGASPYWVQDTSEDGTERDRKNRKPLRLRLFSVMFYSHGWIHLVVILGILAAIAVSLSNSIIGWIGHVRSAQQTGLLVLMTIAWPTLPWVDILTGCIVPLAYAFVPPSVPSREQLMHREPISGLARPLPESKQNRPFREGFFGRSVLFVLQVGYICAIFALTLTPLPI